MHNHENLEQSLAELKELAKREKVQVTPEVRAYIGEHVRKAQDKLAAGRNLTQDDLNFIEEVRRWMGLPPEGREQLPSIEVMNRSEELQEARARKISLNQWFDLLSIYHAIGSGSAAAWIDRTFQFPGQGVIQAENLQFLNGYNRLPENLHIQQDLTIYGIHPYDRLPGGLKIGRALKLRGFLAAIPDDIQIGQTALLEDCHMLTQLPPGLNLQSLDLAHCDALEHLPPDLRVTFLRLSRDMRHKNLFEEAEALKTKGRIKIIKIKQ